MISLESLELLKLKRYALNKQARDAERDMYRTIEGGFMAGKGKDNLFHDRSEKLRDLRDYFLLKASTLTIMIEIAERDLHE